MTAKFGIILAGLNGLKATVFAASASTGTVVDAALVGETVTLRFDPSAPPSRGVEVWHQNQFIARATPLDAYANCFVRRHRPSRTLHSDTPAPSPRPSGLSLRTLKPRRGDEESR